VFILTCPNVEQLLRNAESAENCFNEVFVQVLKRCGRSLHRVFVILGTVALENPAFLFTVVLGEQL
jgi:hypothetical protein